MINTSSEGWKDSIEVPVSPEILRMSLEIQDALMRKYIIERGVSPDEVDINSYVGEWIDANSKEFRVVFEELLKERPNLVKDYESDPQSIVGLINERMAQLVSR